MFRKLNALLWLRLQVPYPAIPTVVKRLYCCLFGLARSI